MPPITTHGAAAPSTSDTAAGEAWTPRAEVEAHRLSPAQARLVEAGTACGDFRMSTIRALSGKGIFFHHITSPNGRCGPVRLTVFGHQVRAALAKARSEGAQS